MKRSVKVALGGILSALSVVCMLFTVFPYATYALPALAGLLLLPVALECGNRWAFVSYAAVATLSFLLSPDMEAKVLFALFFGYYPILKLWLDGLNQLPRWLLKLGLFNAAAVGGYLLMLFVFDLDPDTFQLLGVNLPLVFLLLGNGVFWVYDTALRKIVLMYEIHWRQYLLRLWR